jgi:hypothetical protein
MALAARNQLNRIGHSDHASLSASGFSLRNAGRRSCPIACPVRRKEVTDTFGPKSEAQIVMQKYFSKPSSPQASSASKSLFHRLLPGDDALPFNI